MLGTSLFVLPSTMPASYQPVSTSVMRSSFSTSRVVQPATTNAIARQSIRDLAMRKLYMPIPEWTPEGVDGLRADLKVGPYDPQGHLEGCT
jgi:hypothetical protein